MKKTPRQIKINSKDDPLAGDMSDFISKAKWRKVHFTLSPKTTTVTIRVPQSMVDQARKVAKKRGVKYHRMMRDAIADFLVKAA